MQIRLNFLSTLRIEIERSRAISRLLLPSDFFLAIRQSFTSSFSIEHVEEPPQLIKYFEGEFWRWFRTYEVGQERIALDLPASSLSRHFVTNPANRLAFRDHHEESPQLIAPLRFREATVLNSATEAMKCAQSNVGRVSRGLTSIAKLLSCNPHEPMEVAVPKLGCGFLVSPLKFFHPVGN